MNATRKAILIAASLFLSVPAFADPSFTVGHDYDVNVRTGANTAVALGKDAHAAINNGGMQTQNASVNIGHDYKVNVRTGANTAVALGKDVSAFINNGGIQQTK